MPVAALDRFLQSLYNTFVEIKMLDFITIYNPLHRSPNAYPRKFVNHGNGSHAPQGC